MEGSKPVIQLSSRKFLLGCLVCALLLLLLGRQASLPRWILPLETFATIIALFVFGSIRYQLDKNAITYGAGILILSSFCALSSSNFHSQIRNQGWWQFVHANLLTFAGLDHLLHADTLLFILGLTMFVSV